MKIWIVNHYATLPKQAGGTRHFDLAKFLVSQGHQVSIVLANFKHSTRSYIAKSHRQTGKVETIEGVDLIWIATPAYHKNGIARLTNMIMFGWRLLFGKNLPDDKPDIILGSSPHLFAAFAARLLAKRLNLPFILELRDLWPETLIDLGKISAKHPLIRLMAWMEANLYKSSDHIITLLPMAKPYIVSLGADPAKITWLPNGVDFSSIEKPVTQRSDSGKLVFIYAGTHGLANGLQTVIEAVAILNSNGLSNSFIVKLIGDGPEKNKLIEQAAKLNLANIEFLPPVSKKEIFQHIYTADVGLMLLKDSPVFRWGISPNKLFDYMAMARPIIFGVNTPFNPIAEFEAGLTVQPESAEKLAEVMQKFMAMSQAEREAMGKRAQEYVQQNHDIQVIASKLQQTVDVIGK